MDMVVLVLIVLFAAAAVIVVMVVINRHKRWREAEEEWRRRKAKQVARLGVEEKEQQRVEEKRCKDEDERKRLEEEEQQKAAEEAHRQEDEEQKRLADKLEKAEEEHKRVEEEKRRRAQEEELLKTEKEAQERAEKEELKLLEAEGQPREEERLKTEEERKRAKEVAQEKTEEVRGRERRPPLKRGGRPRGSTKRRDLEQTPGTKSFSLKPEIVCWNEGRRWTLGIEVPEELKTLSVAQNEELLAQDTIDESLYCLRHAEGEVKVTWTGGQKDIPLVGAGRDCLVFKMRKDWKGLGRLIGHPTAVGYYLAIVPQEWKRDEKVSDSASINPESVRVDGYKAHFFCQEQDGNIGIGFVNANGERIQVESGYPRFQIVGREIEDASEDMGSLFGEQLPRIQTFDEKGWRDIGLIVVGEETRGKNRWRMQFVPQVGAEDQDLPEEIANRRGGWYFVRIYDDDDNLLESMDFRFLTALNDVRMESSDFLPGPNGYDNVLVQFLHQAHCRVELKEKDTQHSLKISSESDLTTVIVPPKPDYDKTHWILRDGDAEIEVTVLMERIWWAFGVMAETPTDWMDKPITLSRKDFTATTDKVLWVRFPRPRFVKKIEVGFNRSKSRPYQVEVRKRKFIVPLRDFCDTEEIQNPKQKCFLQLFIDSQDKTHSAPLLRIRFFFRCKDCEFITNSEQEALSHMAVHLSDLIPHLSYEELYQRSGGSLPSKIYKCGYCSLYVRADTPENPTSAIEFHIQHECKKAKHEGARTIIDFRIVSDVDEIRENVIRNLAHIYKCRICGKEFQADDRELRLNHLRKNHKGILFEIS